MAKKKVSVSVKGFLDLDEGVIIEYDKKSEMELEHKLEDLLLPFNGVDNVSINISFDDEIIPK